MKVLVTGGTGVVGEGAVTALLKAGYEVRILAREAGDRAREWPRRVEMFPADVTDPASLHGAANGCAVVVHVTGIVEEHPPESTFTSVNIEGTDHMLAEAKRAGVQRFVYISSLGAERGKSEYQESKRRAEDLVRASKLEWVILRPGNVYGPGDEVISTFLILFRTMPAIPIVGDGNRQFQPIWYRDLGEVIARSIEQPEIAGRTLEVAGDEITTMNELAERFERITGRSPVRIPVPELLAGAGVAFAGLFGADAPLNHAKLTMLIEENVVHAPEGNALLRTFALTPTSLEDGLRELADALPEQLPSEGYGALERKRYWAEIADTCLAPQEILARFREHVRDVMPIEFSAEPGAPQRIEPGATMTLQLPLRGNVQVRVVECTKDRITLATVAGHPLAGAVRVKTRKNGSGTHFEIETLTRPASIVDYVAMKTVGNWLQEANWVEVVERVIQLVNGHAPSGVVTEGDALDDEEAAKVERELEELVTDYRHDRHVTEIQS